MSETAKSVLFHGAVVVLLLALHFVLPVYHHGNLARIMVLAVYAMGYNVLFGYTGLLSLGHAMFFAAGMYGAALMVQHAGWAAPEALLAGVVSAALLSAAVGFLALRTTGVAFMIVTLMFAQAGYLTALYFGEWTRGDEGFVVASSGRVLFGADVSDPDNRYLFALLFFAAGLAVTLWLIHTRFGQVLIAIRENEERTRLLGYDVFRHKLGAVIVSGTLSGAAGAVYALLFGYAGASFATVQYSILPLLWVLLGGAGTIIGPLIGTLFMFYLIDISSGITTAYMLIAGAALVLLTLFARQGIAGELRKRAVPWLP